MRDSIHSYSAGKERRFHTDSPETPRELARCLHKLITSQDGCLYRPFVIFCIGTDRSTGDSLGPLIGSKLSTHQIPGTVYGTLEQPVHATNLCDHLQSINQNHQNPIVIAIDASLGKLDSIGYITLGSGGLQPGSAVKKDLPRVGDIYLTGIVNVGGFMEHLVLQSTRLSLVMKMAETIVDGLCLSFRQLAVYRSLTTPSMSVPEHQL